jgi:hypothetical protein
VKVQLLIECQECGTKRLKILRFFKGTFIAASVTYMCWCKPLGRICYVQPLEIAEYD